jgi:hypothetical protein
MCNFTLKLMARMQEHEIDGASKKYGKYKIRTMVVKTERNMDTYAYMKG